MSNLDFPGLVSFQQILLSLMSPFCLTFFRVPQIYLVWDIPLFLVIFHFYAFRSLEWSHLPLLPSFQIINGNKSLLTPNFVPPKILAPLSVPPSV